MFGPYLACSIACNAETGANHGDLHSLKFSITYASKQLAKDLQVGYVLTWIDLDVKILTFPAITADVSGHMTHPSK